MLTSSTISPPLIHAEALTVLHAERPILREVNFKLDKGEVVAVTGGNGSGKSTLVKSCLGLTPHSSGEVTLFGQNLENFSAWQRIGYLPQRSSAMSAVPATVSEVVATGLLTGRWRPTKTTHKVNQALAAVDLLDRANDTLSTLSGGQQQRALIARALVNRPELLIMDEPNAGIDSQHQLQLAACLQNIAAEGGSIILILHELGPFIDLITRTVHLRHGRIQHPYPGETSQQHHLPQTSKPQVLPDLEW